MHFGDGVELGRVLGYNPFAGVSVWNGVFLAQVVHHLFTSQAQFRFERVGAIVKACVDHLDAVSLHAVDRIAMLNASRRNQYVSSHYLAVS